MNISHFQTDPDLSERLLRLKQADVPLLCLSLYKPNNYSWNQHKANSWASHVHQLSQLNPRISIQIPLPPITNHHIFFMANLRYHANNLILSWLVDNPIDTKRLTKGLASTHLRFT